MKQLLTPKAMIAISHTLLVFAFALTASYYGAMQEFARANFWLLLTLLIETTYGRLSRD